MNGGSAHLRNNPVEPAPRIPESVLPRGQLAEVGRRPRDVVVEQLEHDAPARLCVDVDVKLGFRGW
jgi:hypothetical protein